jgi:hypothetical protein
MIVLFLDGPINSALSKSLKLDNEILSEFTLRHIARWVIPPLAFGDEPRDLGKEMQISPSFLHLQDKREPCKKG